MKDTQKSADFPLACWAWVNFPIPAQPRVERASSPKFFLIWQLETGQMDSSWSATWLGPGLPRSVFGGSPRQPYRGACLGLWGLKWLSNHLNTLQGGRYPPLQNVSESTVSPHAAGCLPDGDPGLTEIRVSGPRQTDRQALSGQGSPHSSGFTFGRKSRLIYGAQSWESGRGLGLPTTPNLSAHSPTPGAWLPAPACLIMHTKHPFTCFEEVGSLSACGALPTPKPPV